MAQFLLNEDQKTLLKSLVPGLKSARIGLNWKVISSNHITFIYENGRIDLRVLGWDKATLTDFNQFVSQGFFRVTQFDRMSVPSKYILDDALIIRAAENNFHFPDVTVSPEA